MGIRQLFGSITLCVLFSATVHAQSPDAAREAAADRYLQAVSMSKMMEDTYSQMARQVPADKQAKFIADMRAMIQISRLEQITKTAMIKTFTAEELNALADFYSSKNGASAMSKYGAYMAEIMPPLMQEVRRAFEEIKARGEK